MRHSFRLKNTLIMPVSIASVMLTGCQTLPQSVTPMPQQSVNLSAILPKVVSVTPHNFPALNGKLIFIYLTGQGDTRQAQLIETNIDGSQPKSLFKVNGTIMSLSSSLADKRLIFTVQQGKSYPKVLILDRDTLQFSDVSADRTNNFSGAISPNGQQLLLSNSQTGNPEIFLTDAKGKVQQQLTHQRAIDIAPVWMPDGQSFIFTSDTDKFLQPQLYQYHLISNQYLPLTVNGNANAIARVSPRGNLITYVVNNTQGMLMDLSTKKTTAINNEGLAEPANFSPDGQYLVYSAKDRINIMPIPVLNQANFPKTNDHLTLTFAAPNHQKFTIREPIWVKE